MSDLLLLILSSPSGAGKTTLQKHLLDEIPGLTFSVSHTTRAPRPGEEDGSAYHFVERETFERMRDEGAFIEWAEVHGNLYGTSASELARAVNEGRAGIVFDIDYQGARQIKAKRPDAVSIFVLPPSIEELEKRLRARRTDADEVIERRLRKATEEIEHYGFFEYLVVNDDLEAAKRAVVGIAEAERHRRQRLAYLAEALLPR